MEGSVKREEEANKHEIETTAAQRDASYFTSWVRQSLSLRRFNVAVRIATNVLS